MPTASAATHRATQRMSDGGAARDERTLIARSCSVMFGMSDASAPIVRREIAPQVEALVPTRQADRPRTCPSGSAAPST